MDRVEIEAKVKAIVAVELGFKESQIKCEDNFIEDLAADSLDVLDLVLHLEEEFNIEIPDESWSGDDRMQTVQDVINYVVDKKADPARY